MMKYSKILTHFGFLAWSLSFSIQASAESTIDYQLHRHAAGDRTIIILASPQNIWGAGCGDTQSQPYPLTRWTGTCDPQFNPWDSLRHSYENFGYYESYEVISKFRSENVDTLTGLSQDEYLKLQEFLKDYTWKILITNQAGFIHVTLLRTRSKDISVRNTLAKVTEVLGSAEIQSEVEVFRADGNDVATAIKKILSSH